MSTSRIITAMAGILTFGLLATNVGADQTASAEGVFKFHDTSIMRVVVAQRKVNEVSAEQRDSGGVLVSLGKGFGNDSTNVVVYFGKDPLFGFQVEEEFVQKSRLLRQAAHQLREQETQTKPVLVNQKTASRLIDQALNMVSVRADQAEYKNGVVRLFRQAPAGTSPYIVAN